MWRNLSFYIITYVHITNENLDIVSVIYVHGITILFSIPFRTFRTFRTLNEYFSNSVSVHLDCSYTYFFRHQISSTQEGRDTSAHQWLIHSNHKAIMGIRFSQYILLLCRLCNMKELLCFVYYNISTNTKMMEAVFWKLSSVL